MAPWTGGVLRHAKAKMVWKENGEEVEQMPGIPGEAGWLAQRRELCNQMFALLPGWK